MSWPRDIARAARGFDPPFRCALGLAIAMVLVLAVPLSATDSQEAGSEEAAEAAAPGPRYRGGIRIAVNRGRPIEATPETVALAGVTNAPPGSRVTVTIGDESRDTHVEPGGGWAFDWPGPWDLGNYRVDVRVISAENRSGRTRQLLIVTPGGRIPRRIAETQQPEYRPVTQSANEDFNAFTDRWRIVDLVPPYEINKKSKGKWDPYNQNKLKGDFPIKGNDVFLSLTAISDTLVEPRTLPTPSGVSTTSTGITFFGETEQVFGIQNVFLTADYYKAQTAYRPFDWRFRGTVAANLNHITTEENTVVKPDPRRGDTRTENHFAVQELFYEKKLKDLSDAFDFMSIRVGVQPFVSDFRGFIFSDFNLGVRLFGNLRSNRFQYNLAYFDRLEKDTNSGLNTFEFRDQQVWVANLYKQDFLVKGFTTEGSLVYVQDDATLQFDTNIFLARPDPIGDFQPHEVEALYLGWTNFGHIGRYNIDSALYYVTGTDSLNPIAGRQLVLRNGEFSFLDEVDISAYMAAFEISKDRDWYRPKIGFFYASGDDNLNDRDAEGFDAIFDNVNFAGGGFSFWNRMGIRLAGSGVALVNRGSLLPDLHTAKEEGQPNYVNPGLQLLTLGLDVEFTPKLKGIFTGNYLRFDATEVIEGILFQAPIDKEIGLDVSGGFRYRPYLNQNFVILAGAAAFAPGKGWEQIFESDDILYHFFSNVTLTF